MFHGEYRRANGRPDGPGEGHPRLPGNLPELRKWPAARLREEGCVIGGDLYPAPARLSAREVLWWIDMTQIRVSASRNLLSGSLGAVLDALLGSAATTVGTAFISPWSAPFVGAGASILVVIVVARAMLKDSDHAPLEQRLMLYRQRARDLGVL